MAKKWPKMTQKWGKKWPKMAIFCKKWPFWPKSGFKKVCNTIFGHFLTTIYSGNFAKKCKKSHFTCSCTSFWFFTAFWLLLFGQKMAIFGHFWPFLTLFWKISQNGTKNGQNLDKNDKNWPKLAKKWSQSQAC